MSDELKAILVGTVFCILVAVLGLFIIGFVITSDKVDRLRGEAISRGYAEFVYKNDCIKFEWKDPPVEKPAK